jgi:hypothetical protein
MLKKISFLIFLLIIISHASWAVENWTYNKEKNIVYSIYETVDNQHWNVFIALQLNSNKIMLEALIPFSDYQKYYTFNLPTKILHKGKNLVRHDAFIWKYNNNSVDVDIDGESIDGFYFENSYRVVYRGNQYGDLIQKLKKGKVLKINNHYFNKRGEKGYPRFSLMGFTTSYNKISGSKGSSALEGFKIYNIYCKKIGPRKRIWINTSNGSYALNGPAISWAKNAEKNGYPIIGNDGKLMKIGRDHISPNELSALIKEGLKYCD